MIERVLWLVASVAACMACDGTLLGPGDAGGRPDAALEGDANGVFDGGPWDDAGSEQNGGQRGDGGQALDASEPRDPSETVFGTEEDCARGSEARTINLYIDGKHLEALIPDPWGTSFVSMRGVEPIRRELWGPRSWLSHLSVLATSSSVADALPMVLTIRSARGLSPRLELGYTYELAAWEEISDCGDHHPLMVGARRLSQEGLPLLYSLKSAGLFEDGSSDSGRMPLLDGFSLRWEATECGSTLLSGDMRSARMVLIHEEDRIELRGEAGAAVSFQWRGEDWVFWVQEAAFGLQTDSNGKTCGASAVAWMRKDFFETVMD